LRGAAMCSLCGRASRWSVGIDWRASFGPPRSCHLLGRAQRWWLRRRWRCSKLQV
jgi:hypothetical protein